jgi:hypothetical protein
VQANRDRLWPEIAEHLEDAGKTKGEPEDAFYAAWVESVVQQAIEALAAEYGRKADRLVRRGRRGSVRPACGVAGGVREYIGDGEFEQRRRAGGVSF